MLTPHLLGRLAAGALILGSYAAAIDAATEQTELVSVKTPAGIRDRPADACDREDYRRPGQYAAQRK